MKKRFFAGALLLSVLALASCSREPAMDNQIPVTGFERTLKLDLDGTRFNVPYGYLAGTSRDSATRWPSDEQTVESVQLFSIYVHPKWEGEKLTLEPFNEQNKDKFIKKFKDGLADVDDILIRSREACSINVQSFKNVMLPKSGKQINSYNKDYEAYEEKANDPKVYKEFYYRDNENPVIIHFEYNDERPRKYSFSVSGCFKGMAISYYPSIVEADMNQQNMQKLVLEYQSKLEELIDSFLLNQPS